MWLQSQETPSPAHASLPHHYRSACPGPGAAQSGLGGGSPRQGVGVSPAAPCPGCCSWLGGQPWLGENCAEVPPSRLI